MTSDAQPDGSAPCILCGLPVEVEGQLLCPRCLTIPSRSVQRLELRRLANEAVRARYTAEIPPALEGRPGNEHATRAHWLHWELLLRNVDPRDEAA